MLSVLKRYNDKENYKRKKCSYNFTSRFYTLLRFIPPPPYRSKYRTRRDWEFFYAHVARYAHRIFDDSRDVNHRKRSIIVQFEINSDYRTNVCDSVINTDRIITYLLNIYRFGYYIFYNI